MSKEDTNKDRGGLWMRIALLLAALAILLVVFLTPRAQDDTTGVMLVSAHTAQNHCDAN